MTVSAQSPLSCWPARVRACGRESSFDQLAPDDLARAFDAKPCLDEPMSDYRIHGATGEWEVVIGLEVHAQVDLQRQALLRRLDRVRRRAQQPGQPGRRRHARHAAGPQRASASARRCAPAWRWRRRSIPGRASTGRTISTPDLPQGYQISQLYHPIVGEGEIEIVLDEQGRGARPSGSASSASISSRTPAR